MDVDGDRLSTLGDKIVFQYWVEYADGDAKEALASSRLHAGDEGLVFDASSFFEREVARSHGAEAAGAGGPVCNVAMPPVSLGDADNSNIVNITDGNFVLNFLFLNGPAPASIDTTRVLATGQTSCFNIFHEPIACDGPEVTAGQDGFYQLGVPRCFAAADPDGDGSPDVVLDLRTGLMWQRRPQEFNLNAQGGHTFTLTAARTAAANLVHEGFDDWRLPRIRELITVFDHSLTGAGGVPVPAVFEWGTPTSWGIDKIWSDTNYAQNSARHWRVNPILAHSGHSSDTSQDNGFVAVRQARQGPPHSGLEAPPNAIFVLGDMNADGILNLTDAVNIFNFLFQQGNAPRVFTVRPLAPEGILPGRFAALGTDRVLDTFTGLEWSRAPFNFSVPDDGLLDWDQALFEAERLDLGDLLDWRLPNAYELESLVDYVKVGTPVLHSTFTAFGNTQCTSGGEACAIADCSPFAFCPTGCPSPYWTSTTAGPTHRAFQMFPNNRVDATSGGVAAGAVRCDTMGAVTGFDYGFKLLSDPCDQRRAWVLAVRGP